MTQEQLARVAVIITQIIKENPTASSFVIIDKILTALPELHSNDIIEYFTQAFKAMGIEALDVAQGIAVLQQAALSSPSEVHMNSLWQEIAQVLFFVASVAKGFVPPKWRIVITSVLDAYTAYKEEK